MWFAVLAMASCSPRHEAIVRSLAKPGMGQSISKPRAEAMLRQEGRHGASEWAVGWNGNVLIHRVDGQTLAVDWAVGSGHEGKSYQPRFGDALFQSPPA